MQLGSAYIKAGSWLDAVEVLSRTFGHQVDPGTPPGLLLAAAKLLDAHRATISKEVQDAWAAAARSLTERRADDALDLYLSVPDSALDTTVEPVRSLLAITERYVLRHEVRVLLRSLAELREEWKNDPHNDGNSHSALLKAQAAQLSRAHRELRMALTALSSASANDWTQQDTAYRRIASALDSCCRVPELPADQRAHLEACSERVHELVRRCDVIEQSLRDEAFDVGAEQLAAIPRIDPDNVSAASQSERLPRLSAVFQRIRAFDGWTPAAWRTLEEGVVAEVDAAFVALPGSSLKTRVLDLARERIRQCAAQRDEEHLAEGVGLLEGGEWRAARAWAARVQARHEAWEPASAVIALAEAYEALFDPAETPDGAIGRADAALCGLVLAPEQEALRTHKKRLEAMTECCQHLASDDEATQSLADIVVQNLPAEDPCREDLARGIAATRALRLAVRASRWEEALDTAQRLSRMRMPVMAGVAARWQGLFEQLLEAERLRDEGRYPEAIACLEQARLLAPSVDLGRPAPSAQTIQDGLAVTHVRLTEEWAALQEPPNPLMEEEPISEAQPPGREAPVGQAFATSAEPSPPNVPLSPVAETPIPSRTREVPPATETGRGTGAWLSRAGDWIIATLEERPRAPRRPHGEQPAARRGAPGRGPGSSPLTQSAADLGTAGREVPETAGVPARPGAAELVLPSRRSQRQGDVLWWAIAGASLVGAIALIVALGLSRGRGAGGLRIGSEGVVETAIADVRGLIAAGDVAGATSRLAELQAKPLTDAQSLTVQSLDGCVWLSAQGEAIATETFREDLGRLASLWAGAQARGLAESDAECPILGGLQARVTSAAAARQAYLQALTAQGGLAAWQSVIATLDGLDLNGLDALLPADARFQTVMAQAQAALAGYWLAEGDCAGAAQAVEALAALTTGNGALAEAVSLEELRAESTDCASTQAYCAELAAMGAVDALRLGEDLVALTRPAPDGSDPVVACPGVPVAEEFAVRVGALQTMALQDPAQAVAAALSISEHPWFSDPPLDVQASPAEVVAGAYAVLLAARCDEEGCAAGAPATTQAEAEAFYGAHREALGSRALVALVGALRRSGSRCANCGLPPLPEVASLDLLDPDLGEWTDYGMYPSGNVDDLAWHLNDVFVRNEQEPAYLIPVGEGGAPQPLYETTYAAWDAKTLAVAVQLQAQVVTLKGAVQGWRALWGVQVPGTDAEPVLLVVLWEPDAAPGLWGLLAWQPGTPPGEALLLPGGSLDQTVELRVQQGFDGATYEVYWQGDLVLVGRAPTELRPSAVRFLVGDGCHAWMRSATADVVR